MVPPARSKWTRRVEWCILLGLIAFGLQHVPGTYTLDDFQDEFKLGSPEGIALSALSEASLSGSLTFDAPTRHRISRNAEILVPENTRLRVGASTEPTIEAGEMVLRPHRLELVADKPLTFIYRGVTVAKAKVLRIQPGDPEARVRAVGHYRVLSALATAYRYHRQKAVRRDYRLPSGAEVNFTAIFHPDHPIETAEGLYLYTGSEAGRIHLENAVWKDETWQGGRLRISMPFSDLEPLVNQLLNQLLPPEVEVGGILDLQLQRIHTLSFTENFLDGYVEGRLRYSKSSRVSQVFHPGFKAHVGILFDLPVQTLLQNARAGIRLNNIHSLDFNRSNPIFDKAARNIARKYREEASIEWSVEDEVPEIGLLPGDLFIESLKIVGDEHGFPTLKLELLLLPKPKESRPL